MGGPQSASGEKVEKCDDAPNGSHEDMDGDVNARVTATPTDNMSIAKFLISMVLI